jgi:hypothetical protein
VLPLLVACTVGPEVRCRPSSSVVASHASGPGAPWRAASTFACVLHHRGRGSRVWATHAARRLPSPSWPIRCPAFPSFLPSQRFEAIDLADPWLPPSLLGTAAASSFTRCCPHTPQQERHCGHRSLTPLRLRRACGLRRRPCPSLRGAPFRRSVVTTPSLTAAAAAPSMTTPATAASATMIMTPSHPSTVMLSDAARFTTSSLPAPSSLLTLALPPLPLGCVGPCMRPGVTSVNAIVRPAASARTVVLAVTAALPWCFGGPWWTHLRDSSLARLPSTRRVHLCFVGAVTFVLPLGRWVMPLACYCPSVHLALRARATFLLAVLRHDLQRGCVELVWSLEKASPNLCQAENGCACCCSLPH